MSKIHKNPTISFRPTEYERKEIEARILASGLQKRVYFVRSCIYNRICVVGKKETIFPLVQEVEGLYKQLLIMKEQLYELDRLENAPTEQITSDDITELNEDFTAMLKAIIDLLDGAKYLWQNESTDNNS